MPVIKTKIIRVRNPVTGEWNDLPGVISEESFRAADRADAAEAGAAAAQDAAERAQITAEAWATGGTGGTPGEENNAEYWSGVAEDHAETAEAWATGGSGGTPGAENNAEYWSGVAEDQADAAAGSAESAEAWATGGSGGTASAGNNAKHWSEVSEAWATGGSGGTPGEENNAEYWSGVAEDAAESVSASAAQIAKNAAGIADLDTRLGDSTGNIILPVTGTGGYIDIHSGTTDIETPVSGATASYLVAPCVPGDQFVVTTKGGSSARAYGFVKSDKTTVVSRSDSNLTCDKEVVTAPANAAYLVVNAISGNKLEVIKNDFLVNVVSALAQNSFSLSTSAKHATIPAGADLNDEAYRTAGNFRKTTTSGAVSNCPVGSSVTFALKVMNCGLSNTFCQLLIPGAPSAGYLWYRLIGTSGGSPSYGEWHKIADDRSIDDLEDDIAGLEDDIAGLEDDIAGINERAGKSFLLNVLDDAVQTITANDDLNDFLTVGNYKKTITSGAPSHCPVGSSITFGLKVMQIAASTTYCQILVPAAPSAGYLWYRLIGTSGGSPSYGEWHKIADERSISDLEENLFVHKPTIITKSNVTTYFPNSSFNDAKPNTIYGIAEWVEPYEDPIISDGPPGDQVYGVPVDQRDTPASPVKGWGPRRGTLLTFSQAFGDDDASGLVQIFVEYPGYKNYHGATSPSICYRIAYRENNTYHWSDWSKIAERGVLHAGNGIVYGGQPYIDHAPFTDLNDAPWNSIFHADKNMDGSDEYHTLAHHPTPGESCMITTYAFSVGFDHCRRQVVNSLSGRELWRYEYANGEPIWTDWYEVIHNRGVLGEDANFNARKSNGIWYVQPQSEGNYSNNPLTDAGYLTVRWNDNAGFQRAESLTGERYIRHWDDSTSAWTAWTYDDDGSAIRNKGRLANGSDLNDVQENGVWLLGGQSGAQYVNNPITSGAGYLTVKWNGTIGLQTVEALAGTRYSRYTDDGGTSWGSWV